MNKDNIHHIYPVNDEYEHNLSTEYDMANQIKCRCRCQPKLEFHNNHEGFIVGLSVIHNSFDGREGVEWANEILNDK